MLFKQVLQVITSLTPTQTRKSLSSNNIRQLISHKDKMVWSFKPCLLGETVLDQMQLFTKERNFNWPSGPLHPNGTSKINNINNMLSAKTAEESPETKNIFCLKKEILFLKIHQRCCWCRMQSHSYKETERCRTFGAKKVAPFGPWCLFKLSANPKEFWIYYLTLFLSISAWNK